MTHSRLPLSQLRHACHAAATAAATVLALGASTASQAAIVPLGSSYTFYLQGSSSTPTGYSARFDGAAETAGLNAYGGNERFTLTESQTDLGGGLWQLLFSVQADVPLWPVPGESGLVGIGIFDPVDLVESARLVQAITRAFGPTGNPIGQGGNAGGPGPWNGAWPGPSGAAGLTGLGGRAHRFDVELRLQTLNPVPAPGTAALVLLALGALAARGRLRMPMGWTRAPRCP